MYCSLSLIQPHWASKSGHFKPHLPCSAFPVCMNPRKVPDGISHFSARVDHICIQSEIKGRFSLPASHWKLHLFAGSPSNITFSRQASCIQRSQRWSRWWEWWSPLHPTSTCKGWWSFQPHPSLKSSHSQPGMVLKPGKIMGFQLPVPQLVI